MTQPHPGIRIWTSPHGYRYRVDRHGTHPLGNTPPNGIEVIPTPDRIDLHPDHDPEDPDDLGACGDGGDGRSPTDGEDRDYGDDRAAD